MNGISARIAPSDIEIGKTSSFVDENGIMHLYGEVRNLSTKPMSNVVVKASFFDDNGKLLNEFNRSTELSKLNPGGISPFEILYIDSKTVNQVRDFKISTEISSSPAENKLKPVRLEVNPTNSRLDIFGFYYINGIVVNNAKANSTNTLIIATLYDKNGNVIAIGRGLAEPLNITAGSNGVFGLVVSEKLQTYKTTSYSLIADSDEYTSVPTFTRANR
ncbi:MAG: FxLYD domain-containing protein [Nitrososphaeraceae archaeon]|jgi:hypothetical protein